jgi:hypothetical protein
MKAGGSRHETSHKLHGRCALRIVALYALETWVWNSSGDPALPELVRLRASQIKAIYE